MSTDRTYNQVMVEALEAQARFYDLSAEAAALCDSFSPAYRDQMVKERRGRATECRERMSAYQRAAACEVRP